MQIRAFITHKKAEHYSDCQDRFSINPDTKSIALSDGMTQSIFQKYWAQLLAEKYTSDINWIPNLESVRELSEEWLKIVKNIIQERTIAGDEHIWRGERQLSEGRSAGATFLGVRFNGFNWECDVLGDSCLILIKDDHIEEIISSKKGNEFDNFPDYYDSNPLRSGRGTIYSERKGILKSGEIMLMVTDPFSDFLSKNSKDEKIKHLVHRLLGVNTHKEFEEVVEEWRNNGMHNDDSTLIIIEPDGSDSFTLVQPDDIEKLTEEENQNIESQEQTLSHPENIEFNGLKNNEENQSEGNNEISNESVRPNIDILFNAQFDEKLFEFFSKKVLNLQKPKKGSKDTERIEKYIEGIKTIIKEAL